MTIEYEAKVLNIKPEVITRRIIDCGGEIQGETKLMQRFVYDVRPDDPSCWMRLRNTGATVTLAIKKIHHDGIDGTDETEIEVDDFEKAYEFLARLGYTPKSYQENKRTSFLLNGVRLEIDEWPFIPPYLEIEADSYEQVVESAEKLGFNESQLTSKNTTKIYELYGIELEKKTELRFPE